MLTLSYTRLVWIIENWFSILTEESGDFEIKPFSLRPYQKRTLKEIYDNPGKNVLIEKTRQLGISWLMAAYYAATFLYAENQQMLVLGKREDFVDNAELDTNTLMGKVKFIVSHVRDENTRKLYDRKIKLNGKKVPALEMNYLFMKNNLLGNIVNGESASSKSGRGGTYSLVWWDEVCFTESSRQLFAAVKPNSKRLILISTLNPWDRGNIFNEIRKNIDVDENIRAKWYKIRIHWSEYYDQAWYESMRSNLNNDPILIAAELDIDDRGPSSHLCFSTFGNDNFKAKAIFNPDLISSSVLAFDFGISDYTTGGAIQYNKANGEILIIDGFELNNVPFARILQAIFAPSPLLIQEIMGKTSKQFAQDFQRFYLNAKTFGYHRFIISGDPSGAARSINTGTSITDEIGKYTSKSIFYREDTESVLSWIRGKSDKTFINPSLTNFREMISNYRYELNRDGNPVAPLHDNYSHLADAFRYGMLTTRRLFVDGGQAEYADNWKHFDPNNRKVYLRV